MLNEVFNHIKKSKSISDADLLKAFLPMSSYGMQRLINQLLFHQYIKASKKDDITYYRIKRWYEW